MFVWHSLKLGIKEAVKVREAGYPGRSIMVFWGLSLRALNERFLDLYFECRGQLVVAFKHLYQNTGQSWFLDKMIEACQVSLQFFDTYSVAPRYGAVFELRLADAIMLQGDLQKSLEHYLRAWDLLVSDLNSEAHARFEYAMHLCEAYLKLDRLTDAWGSIEKAQMYRSGLASLPGWHQRIILSRYFGLLGGCHWKSGNKRAAVFPIYQCLTLILRLAFLDGKPQRLNQLIQKISGALRHRIRGRT